MRKIVIGLALCTSALAMPAIAADMVSTRDMPVSAVADTHEIAHPPLPSGRQNIGFEADPDYFVGKLACVAGTGANWPLKRDGTPDRDDPARRPSCVPVGADGQVNIPNPFGAGAVPYLANPDGTLAAWIGRDRLTGLAN